MPLRLFALKDSSDPEGSLLAVLCYYEAYDECYIDMPPYTDPWTVPFVLSSFASRGIWSVSPEWSKRWVESRLVPRSRQNLGEVLRVNGLDDYDALRLLELTEGRNSQDDCYLEPLRFSDCPEWFQEQERRRVVDAVSLEGRRLLVAFRTGDVRLYSADEVLSLNDAFAAVIADDETFDRVEVAPGGRGVRWGHVASLSDNVLVAGGTLLPITWDDMKRIVPALLMDATEAAEALGCTRQNLHALAKRGSLPIAKSSGKATLFLRADIQSRVSGFPVSGTVALTHYAVTKL